MVGQPASFITVVMIDDDVVTTPRPALICGFSGGKKNSNFCFHRNERKHRTLKNTSVS
jgi:hypothetical protein